MGNEISRYMSHTSPSSFPPIYTPPIPKYNYQFLGCYKDSPNRVFNYWPFDLNSTSTIENCALESAKRKATHFGIQWPNPNINSKNVSNKGVCSIALPGEGQNYGKYGTTGCGPIYDSKNRKLGDAWVLSVHKMNYPEGFENKNSVQNQEQDKKNMEQFSNSTNGYLLGCYPNNKVLNTFGSSLNFNSSNMTKDQCFIQAQNKNSSFFGLTNTSLPGQNLGDCYTGNSYGNNVNPIPCNQNFISGDGGNQYGGSTNGQPFMAIYTTSDPDSYNKFLPPDNYIKKSFDPKNPNVVNVSWDGSPTPSWTLQLTGRGPQGQVVFSTNMTIDSKVIWSKLNGINWPSGTNGLTLGQIYKNDVETLYQNSDLAKGFKDFKELCKKIGVIDNNNFLKPVGMDDSFFQNMVYRYRLSIKILKPSNQSPNNKLVINEYVRKITGMNGMELGALVGIQDGSVSKLEQLSQFVDNLNQFNSDFQMFSQENQNYLQNEENVLNNPKMQKILSGVYEKELKSQLENIVREQVSQIQELTIQYNSQIGKINDIYGTTQNKQKTISQLSESLEKIQKDSKNMEKQLNTKKQLIEINQEEILKNNVIINILIIGIFFVILSFIPFSFFVKKSISKINFTIIMLILFLIFISWSYYQYTNMSMIDLKNPFNNFNLKNITKDIYKKEKHVLNTLRQYAYSDKNCCAK